MSGVGNLRDVLELIIDGLNDRAFAQEELIYHWHQLIVHILADGRDELNTLAKELLE